MTNDTAVEGNRAAELSELLAEAPVDSTDHDAVRKFIHLLAEAGLALLFIYPNSKLPADMRTSQQRGREDRAAQDAAREAGRRDWAKVKSPAGLALATTDTEVLDTYLDRYIRLSANGYGSRVPVNLAVEVGQSRLVVVDCDTREQLEAFLTDAGADHDTSPTVRSPGQRDAVTGDWVHSDGGHFYFTVPEGVELPRGTGAMPVGGTEADSSRYSVLWDRRYVLIPPSVRAEGAYTVTGKVHALADAEQLLDRINEHAQMRANRASRARTRPVGGGNQVEAWGTSVTWAEILDGTDWLPSGKVDSCGCDVWTAPGAHASPKSATAHEPGCGQWVKSPDPPLHIWTDHDIEPFGPSVAANGRPTVTRLEAEAAIRHQNNLGETITALDLGDDLALHEELPIDFGRADCGGGDSAPHACTYPSSFWESRESLLRIRDGALKLRSAPDATLVATLSRLSAVIPPGVRVDTGIMKPIPLHLFGAPTSRSGKGKTTAINVSEDIVHFELGWAMDPLGQNEECPIRRHVGDNFPHVGKIRTGEGVAEMFYGKATVTNPATGKPKEVRARVRSNVLMITDEGSSIVKLICDPKSIVGETVREGWSGVALGQSNADEDKYRYVPRGQYTLAIIVGFQLSVLADLLVADELAKGTPQRFLFAWAKPDPTIVTPELLAELRNSDNPLWTVPVPATGLRLCEALRAQVDADQLLEWFEDDDEKPVIESQRTAMVARLAALLAILDGREDTDELGLLVITEEDWSLAETMFAASCSIAALAVADRRMEQAKAKQHERARNLAESIEDDDARSTPVGRAKARVIGYLTSLGSGEHKWSGDGILRRFNQTDAEHANAALVELVGQRAVRLREGSRGSKFVELIR